MNLVPRKWALTLASTLAAALLAACGGGSNPPPATQASAPVSTSILMSESLPVDVASTEVTSTPVDTDRAIASGPAVTNNAYIVQMDDSPVTAYDGSIQGLDDIPGGAGKIVRAEVPLAEMFGYSTTLRSLSQGRATYSMEFKHYSEAPKNVAEAIINKK